MRQLVLSVKAYFKKLNTYHIFITHFFSFSFLSCDLAQSSFSFFINGYVFSVFLSTCYMKQRSYRVSNAFSACSLSLNATKPHIFDGIIRIFSILPKGLNFASRLSRVVSSSIPPTNRVVMLTSAGGSGTLNSLILSSILLANGSPFPSKRALILSSTLP